MAEESKPLELDIAQQIDSACDQFELAWKSGNKPRIEDFLASADKAYAQEFLRSLLQVEMELLRRDGQKCLPSP